MTGPEAERFRRDEKIRQRWNELGCVMAWAQLAREFNMSNKSIPQSLQRSLRRHGGATIAETIERTAAARERNKQLCAF